MIGDCSEIQSKIVYQGRAMKMFATKLPLRNSVFACFFLSLYVGVYMAAGFLGLQAVEWAWVKLIG
jgi:hypothetical protein